MADYEHIFEGTADNFQRLVIEGSAEHPVLVDFWAAWCAPCQMLMPVLQSLVDDYDGRVTLVKVNSDQEQDLATHYGVRSLPTVKLFRDGEVVEEFIGMQPEPAIRALIERHLPRPSDPLRVAAEAALAAGDAGQAVALLRQALTVDADNPGLQVALAAALIAAGTAVEAKEILEQLPYHRREDDDVKRLLALVSFAVATQDAPTLEQLKQRVGTHPEDLEARYLLGTRHIAAEAYADGMDQFLEIMQRDRRFREDIGRNSLLQVFEILGDTHPELTNDYRRRMSRLLY